MFSLIPNLLNSFSARMEIETLFSTPLSSSDAVLKNTRLIPELYATRERYWLSLVSTTVVVKVVSATNYDAGYKCVI